jgi:hypothetical protein
MSATSRATDVAGYRWTTYYIAVVVTVILLMLLMGWG